MFVATAYGHCVVENTGVFANDTINISTIDLKGV
jgi:hypothetical protein